MLTNIYDRDHVLMKRIAACTRTYHFLVTAAVKAEAEHTAARELVNYSQSEAERFIRKSVERFTSAAEKSIALLNDRDAYADYTEAAEAAAYVWRKAVKIDDHTIGGAIENITIATQAVRDTAVTASRLRSAATQFAAEYFRIYDMMQLWYNASPLDTNTAATQYHTTVKEVYNAARYFLKSVGYADINGVIAKLP